MMRLDPSLVVLRLVIEGSGRTVYNEHFHSGVNIIRGENSSGKSTILNFIFYALGGDLTDWSEAALRCSHVTVEVELNGIPLTLSREVTDIPRQPMDVFGGPYKLAIKAPRSEWTRYPYSRSSTRESFSQALFRLLGLPEVINEVSGSLTMHQVLRLLYADQLSPVDDIFKLEPFDRALIRDAIGRLLCGAYDNRVYSNQLRIRELEKELSDVNAELSSLFRVLGRTGESMTLDWIAAEGQRLEGDERTTQREIEEAERRLYSAADEDKITLAALEGAFSEVQTLQGKIAAARHVRDGLALAIADSDAFIAALGQKLSAMHDASSAVEALGEIKFTSCPACHAPILDDTLHGVCHLCRTPFDPERSRNRLAAFINDTAIQLKQSRILQEDRKERLRRAETSLTELEAVWRRTSERLRELQRLPSTEARSQLRELQRRAGYLQRQLEDLDERAKAVALAHELSGRKSQLSASIARLKAENDSIQAEQEQRLRTAYNLISAEVLYLLRRDLRRQDSFENPERVDFSFEQNKISVDGQTYFSASSRVILKNSFFSGFLFAALKEKFFRHPRFCMLDTVEDKGMEPERSHNFQMLIAGLSDDSDVRHQIIMGTQMIAPDLDDERYTVGKYSTRDEPTLDLVPT
jgi:DNA repair exonuclease SbcCD ATPase subunit